MAAMAVDCQLARPRAPFVGGGELLGLEAGLMGGGALDSLGPKPVMFLSRRSGAGAGAGPRRSAEITAKQAARITRTKRSLMVFMLKANWEGL